MKTAAEFFTAAALAQERVPLPDGGAVVIRELSALQRAEFARVQATERETVAAWLASQACMSDDGFRLFSDDDVGQLMVSSPRFVEHVALNVMRLSGLTKDAKPGND